jgi:hypothetical protein
MNNATLVLIGNDWDWYASPALRVRATENLSAETHAVV